MNGVDIYLGSYQSNDSESWQIHPGHDETKKCLSYVTSTNP